MKSQLSEKSKDVSPKSEYSVQFECVSTFLTYFEDTSGLSDHQIIEKAMQIAATAFEQGGSLTLERTSLKGSYVVTALGVDPQTALITGKPEYLVPLLKIVK